MRERESGDKSCFCFILFFSEIVKNRYFLAVFFLVLELVLVFAFAFVFEAVFAFVFTLEVDLVFVFVLAAALVLVFAFVFVLGTTLVLGVDFAVVFGLGSAFNLGLDCGLILSVLVFVGGGLSVQRGAARRSCFLGTRLALPQRGQWAL